LTLIDLLPGDDLAKIMEKLIRGIDGGKRRWRK